MVQAPPNRIENEYFSRTVPQATTSPSYPDQSSQALESARTLIREDLDKSWDLLVQQAQDAPGELPERLRWLSARQGKRVRSTLLLLSARLGNTPDLEAARLSAAAIELLHVASLAHDDVIDESELRRGEASAPLRWGNKMAVLVGDYVFARSMKLAIRTRLPDVVEAINRASCQLVAGEVAELDLSRHTAPTWALYREVIHLKTASLLETCCRCGAISAGLGPEQIEAAGRLGYHFGMAFQMVDDLLDLGGVADLDKPARLDLANGLVSFPALIRRELTGRSLADLAALPTQTLFLILHEEGVLSQSLEMIAAELDLAAGELVHLPDVAARLHLQNLLTDLKDRSIRSLAG